MKNNTDTMPKTLMIQYSCQFFPGLSTNSLQQQSKYQQDFIKVISLTKYEKAAATEHKFINVTLPRFLENVYNESLYLMTQSDSLQDNFPPSKNGSFLIASILRHLDQRQPFSYVTQQIIRLQTAQKTKLGIDLLNV